MCTAAAVALTKRTNSTGKYHAPDVHRLCCLLCYVLLLLQPKGETGQEPLKTKQATTYTHPDALKWHNCTILV